MCTRCLRNTNARFVPEEDVSFIGTDDGDDESLIDLIRNSEPGTPMVYRSALNIKVNCKIKAINLGSLSIMKLAFNRKLT